MGLKTQTNARKCDQTQINANRRKIKGFHPLVHTPFCCGPREGINKVTRVDGLQSKEPQNDEIHMNLLWLPLGMFLAHDLRHFGRDQPLVLAISKENRAHNGLCLSSIFPPILKKEAASRFKLEIKINLSSVGFSLL